MYEGITSEEMIECYNIVDSTIDCEWTFKPQHDNQTILHITFNGKLVRLSGWFRCINSGVSGQL